MANQTATTLTEPLNNTAREFPSRRAISVSGKLDLTHALKLTFANTIEFVIMFLAVIRARATAAPLNAAYTLDEFGFYLLDSESKILITSQDGNEPAQSAASKLKIQHVTALLSSDDGEVVLTSSGTIVESSPDLIKNVVNEPSDLALSFTLLIQQQPAMDMNSGGDFGGGGDDV